MSSAIGDERNGRHRGASRANRRRLTLRCTQAVAAATSTVLFVGSGLAWYNYRALDNGIRSVRVDGLGGAAPPGYAQRAGKAQNILIVGDDSRAGLTRAEGKTLGTGSTEQTTSTDTIMLAHIPADGSKATLISIPRDSYVTIPHHPKGKINAAYADGYYYTPSATTDQERQTAGFDLLVSTVKLLTGVPIDHYVQIGFAGFEKVVKAVGTITVNLCHAVDDTVAYNKAHNQSGGSGFVSSAGVQYLDPVRALEFVRQRHNLPGIGDDFGREQRQRYFISAIFHAVLSTRVLLKPIKLHNTVKAIAGAFVKDPGFQLASLAQELESLSAGNIGGQTIPTKTGPDVAGIGSVLYVDPTTVQRVVTRAFYGSPASSSQNSAAPPNSPGTSGRSASSDTGSASSSTHAAPKPSCIN